MTLEHSSKICKQAYPPGKHFTVPEWPDIEEVNARGDYATEYSRLAFIDGDRDPWRYCVSLQPFDCRSVLADTDRHLRATLLLAASRLSISLST